MNKKSALLRRRDLPSFGYLKSRHFDIQQVLELCENLNLFDYEQYKDIQTDSGSKMAPYIRAYADCKEAFFSESATYRDGEKYRQKYLTFPNFDTSLLKEEWEKPVPLKQKLIRLRGLRGQKNPVVDEINYSVQNELVTGVFKEILDSFKSKLTRVRLAYLGPKYSIRPHIDADTNLIMRYHFPIITNPSCFMHVKRNGEERRVHWPADGRLYFLNAGIVHWTSNESDLPRLHLIIDVHGQDEVADLVPIE